jgi:hypothetical protein
VPSVTGGESVARSTPRRLGPLKKNCAAVPLAEHECDNNGNSGLPGEVGNGGASPGVALRRFLSASASVRFCKKQPSGYGPERRTALMQASGGRWAVLDAASRLCASPRYLA